MTDWSSPVHKERKVNGYHLKCYVDDPYYWVKVYKDEKEVDGHLLNNDSSDWESLIRVYEEKS